MRLRGFIRLMFITAVVYMALLTAFAYSPESDAKSRAIVKMAWGLFLLWVVIGGALTLHYRDRIRQRVLAIGANWQLKFVVFATVLALLEELITTAMTNLAPLFGVKMGEAYITASANYFEVVFFHSVIVFIPMFIGWAWLLRRYDFSPNAVFILFGVTGTLSGVDCLWFQHAHQFCLLAVRLWHDGLLTRLQSTAGSHPTSAALMAHSSCRSVPYPMQPAGSDSHQSD